MEDRSLSDIVWTPERGLAEPEVRSISWNNLLLSDDPYMGKWRTDAGVRVTPETALQSTVVLACCRILAESISSLPLHVYRRGEDGTKVVARDIPLYRVLSFAPNSWQTKFEWVEQLVMTLCLWGNSYTQIKSGKYGAVSELINLHPSRMDVERLENGRLRYSYTNPETGRLERYTQDQIMHVRWTPEQDGIKGMVPVEVAREAIALARACEIHASKYWANSARPGVVLQTEGSLYAEAAERLRDNWERLHRGVSQSWRTAVLTNGLKAEPIGFTAEQSQYIDSRKYQCEEIARVYRLPVHLIQGTSGGNLETAGQEFVTYTLVPWLKRIESAISRSLIYNDDLFVAEFDVRGLLRGDSNTRAGYYSTMTNLGVLSINEVRRLENLPPLGPEADHHFVAMNMQTLEDASKPKQDPMAAAMGGGAPPPAPGGPPSLPEVKTGSAPIESPKGTKSEPKPDPEKRDCGTGSGGFKSGNKCAGGSDDSPTDSPVRGLRRGDGNKKQTRVARKLYQLGTTERKVKDMVAKLGGKPGRSSVDMQDGKVNIFVRDHSGNELYHINVGYNGAHVDSVDPIDDKKAEEILSIAKDALPQAISDRLFGAGKEYPVTIGHGSKEYVANDKKKLLQSRAFCATGEGGGVKNDCGGEKSSPDTGGGTGGGTGPASSSDDDVSTSQLLAKIAANPYGVTLDPYSADQPETGIMVSEFKNGSNRNLQIKKSDMGTQAAFDALKGWIAKNTDAIKGRTDRYIGGWMTADGVYHLDISTRFEPDQAEQALEAGRKAGQLAVFNLGTLKETWVKYENQDSRKPEDWDKGFAKTRKAAAVSQVYDQDSPDLQDEDHAAELSRHGKNTVRNVDMSGYTSTEDTLLSLIREVKKHGRREADNESRHSNGRVCASDVSRDEVMDGGDDEGRREDASRLLVQGRSGGHAGTVRGSEDAERLIAELRAFDTESSVKVEFRDFSGSHAIAAYDDASGTIYVSDAIGDGSVESFKKSCDSGWLSQPNPLMHELAHLFHKNASERSYASSIDVTFTDEQRSAISSEVSRYACTNGREFMAEFLSGAWAGKEYSEPMVGIYESILSTGETA